jgi:hypothetical protein
MSTLRLTTISNQTGSSSVPSDTVINGSAKAWVNFNGSGTVAIRASFNVSSITDNSTGNYTVNFTAALADINFSAVASCNDNGGAYGAYSQPVSSVSSVTIATSRPGTANYDQSNIAVAVFR